ncbi:hypothetical protein [Nitrososphaera viennensis]|uniref:Uncharacterized protein n=2 Tax=Nitrososphaera viennensis TaxID=1034015 RepID=A0A060HS81_9ARCH|nr:hypothetical protein [Nitrososphaera viennensis]AIC16346.1 hypothetical protein NVIE_020850 [Nitrososphaera viennensis EN76]UVS68282.1 hypothetical protein NWT39_10275 [Nitrososphaera viennensis]
MQQQQAVTATTIIIGSERHFALCESCFWSATVFGRDAPACPSCTGGNVSMIPLARDEEYRVRVLPSAGVEMSFSRAKKK